MLLARMDFPRASWRSRKPLGEAQNRKGVTPATVLRDPAHAGSQAHRASRPHFDVTWRGIASRGKRAHLLDTPLNPLRLSHRAPGIHAQLLSKSRVSDWA